VRTSRPRRTGPSSPATSSISPTSLAAERVACGSRLLDDLVGPADQLLREGEAEGPGRFQIDDEVELGRLLYGKIGGLRAPPDLVFVGGGRAVVCRPTPGPRHE